MGTIIDPESYQSRLSKSGKGLPMGGFWPMEGSDQRGVEWSVIVCELSRRQQGEMLQMVSEPSSLPILYSWDDLKELIGTTYNKNMHLLYGNLSLKNSTVKSVWLGVVMGWVTFYEFLP